VHRYTPHWVASTAKEKDFEVRLRDVARTEH
jgi:hypothetical protein